MSKSLGERIEELSKELEDLKCELIKMKLNNCKRWKAECGKTYYHIYSDGEITSNPDISGEVSTNHYNLGNYFQTREEAEKVVEKIKIYTQLKDLALRLNKGEEIDWTNDDQTKYYIYYDHETMQLDYKSSWSFQWIGQIYCLDENFLEEAKREIEEENLMKLFE